MTDWREPFLATIREHVDSDAPRLVYADQLEERGECDLAEFIRVGCELAGIPWECECEPQEKTCIQADLPLNAYCRACVLRRRERELLEANWSFWVGDISKCFDRGSICLDGIVNDETNTTIAEWGWSRGFISTVRLPSAALLGRECERCEEIIGPNGRRRMVRDGEGPESRWVKCDCINGNIPGIAAALGRLPGLERVELSDKRADIHQVPPRHQSEFGVENFNWWIQVMNGIPYDLPADIFLRLEGDLENLRSDIRRAYPSASAAHDALAIAAAQWCRIASAEANKREGVTV